MNIPFIFILRTVNLYRKWCKKNNFEDSLYNLISYLAINDLLDIKEFTQFVCRNIEESEDNDNVDR